jgi:hypothetical protein
LRWKHTGPFWARINRCTEADVTQLNFFHAKRVAALDSFAKSMVPPKYNLGLATIIGTNEVYVDSNFAQISPAPRAGGVVRGSAACALFCLYFHCLFLAKNIGLGCSGALPYRAFAPPGGARPFCYDVASSPRIGFVNMAKIVAIFIQIGGLW